MAKLFGVDIKKLVKDTFKGELIGGVLTVMVQGSRTDGSLTDGPAETEKPYPFEGIISDFKVGQVDGTNILKGDKKVLIIAGTLPDAIIPSKGDKIVIDGETVRVVALLKVDPARATYTVQGRG
jgi:hypothetical protein